MDEPIPNKDHDPAEDSSRMMQQVYTGLGIPPTTSMWHLPRKPLSPRAGVKSALKTPKGAVKGHGKSRSRGRGKTRSKPSDISGGWD